MCVLLNVEPFIFLLLQTQYRESHLLSTFGPKIAKTQSRRRGGRQVEVWSRWLMFLFLNLTFLYGKIKNTFTKVPFTFVFVFVLPREFTCQIFYVLLQWDWVIDVCFFFSWPTPQKGRCGAVAARQWSATSVAWESERRVTSGPKTRPHSPAAVSYAAPPSNS